MVVIIVVSVDVIGDGDGDVDSGFSFLLVVVVGMVVVAMATVVVSVLMLTCRPRLRACNVVLFSTLSARNPNTAQYINKTYESPPPPPELPSQIVDGNLKALESLAMVGLVPKVITILETKGAWEENSEGVSITQQGGVEMGSGESQEADAAVPRDKDSITEGRRGGEGGGRPKVCKAFVLEGGAWRKCSRS